MNMLHPSDARQAQELVLGSLVDLQMSARAIADQGAAIALMAAGLSPDGVLQAETIALNAQGQRIIESNVPAHSIAVVNLGTTVLTVTNSGLASSPPGPGKGTLKVLPGQSVCMPLIGQAHAFYGRPGERLTVVRYKTLQPFMMSEVGAGWFAVPLSTLAIGTPVTYTTPWGDNAYYGGLAISDTGGAAGTGDTSELIITDGNGVELDTLHLAGKETAESTYTRPIAATSSKIIVTLSKGAVEGTIRVW